jgi:3'-phosphoadenosine 5'-phosphosulfate sulfotransferase (PAPS reductase)/FAD synthetase
MIVWGLTMAARAEAFSPFVDRAQEDIEQYDFKCKVEPLQRALKESNTDAWINGRRRDHGAERASLPVWEADKVGHAQAEGRPWLDITVQDVPWPLLSPEASGLQLVATLSGPKQRPRGTSYSGDDSPGALRLSVCVAHQVNPLAFWTFEDCWNYLRKYQAPYHPLHDVGFSSLGDMQSTAKASPHASP